MLRGIGTNRADVYMPWRRLPTDKARRRRIRRWLWIVAAVLLIFLTAVLLIWICTVWTADPPVEESSRLLPGWRAP